MPAECPNSPDHSVLVQGRNAVDRELITGYLAEQLQLRVLGAAGTVGDLLALVERMSPDLVVAQVHSPPLGRSFAVTRAIRLHYSDVDVIVFGSRGVPVTPGEFLEAGASRFLLADATLGCLANAVGEVLTTRA